jgi:hypothetical protein
VLTGAAAGPYDALMRTLTAPPFESVDAAKDFQFLLMVFLRELKRPGEPVGLHQFLLTQALHHHGPKRTSIECRACGGVYPCRTVLTVALLSRFPAPWTPQGMATTLNAVGLLGATVRGNLIFWGDGDPGFTLRRNEDGTWAGERQDRGAIRPMVVDDDAAMCELFVGWCREFPVGLGTVVSAEEIDLVRPGIGPARQWWSEHVKLPYLVHRLQDGLPAEGPEFGDLPPQFDRLTAEDAAAEGQRAAWVIPPGHPLHGRPLRAIARCARCRRVTLFSRDTGFCLVHFEAGGTTEVILPLPAFEPFTDYPAAYAAMHDHCETCDWRPRYPGGWSERYPKPPRYRDPEG